MTRDADFKALVRARMAATGETYSEARAGLLAERDGSLLQWTSRTELPQIVVHMTGVLDAQDLHVWLESCPPGGVSNAPSFEVTVPRAAIVTAQRQPDSRPGGSLGAHGWRGKWLINGTYDRLVRLGLGQPCPARLNPTAAVGDALQGKQPLLLRPLLRTRTVQVKQLTISVNDPDAFLAAVGVAASTGGIRQ